MDAWSPFTRAPTTLRRGACCFFLPEAELFGQQLPSRGSTPRRTRDGDIGLVKLDHNLLPFGDDLESVYGLHRFRHGCWLQENKCKGAEIKSEELRRDEVAVALKHTKLEIEPSCVRVSTGSVLLLSPITVLLP